MHDGDITFTEATAVNVLLILILLDILTLITFTLTN